jgi:hypothetical protein
MKSSSATGRA